MFHAFSPAFADLKCDVSESMATRHFAVLLDDSGQRTRISSSGSSWTTLGLLGRRDDKRNYDTTKREGTDDETMWQPWQGTQFAINRHRESLQLCLKFSIFSISSSPTSSLLQSSTYLPDLGIRAREILGRDAIGVLGAWTAHTTHAMGNLAKADTVICLRLRTGAICTVLCRQVVYAGGS